MSLKAAYYMHSFSSGNLCNQDDCLENWTAFLRPSVIDVYVDSFSAHVIVLGELISSNLFQETDYLLPRLNFGRTFETRILPREEWAADSVLNDCATSVFTDGSKTVQVYILNVRSHILSF